MLLFGLAKFFSCFFVASLIFQWAALATLASARRIVALKP